LDDNLFHDVNEHEVDSLEHACGVVYLRQQQPLIGMMKAVDDTLLNYGN
jgi:hypothetical protein